MTDELISFQKRALEQLRRTQQDLAHLHPNAREEVVNSIVDRIQLYIQNLKRSGKYAEAKLKVVSFEMLANVYDAFGEQIKADPVRNMFSESAVDIERQLRIADKQLCNEGIAVAYGRKYGSSDDLDGYMVDVILFVNDEEQMRQLHDYAKTAYHRLNDQYRQKTTRLSDQLKTKYRNIVRDSAEVSEGNKLILVGGNEVNDYFIKLVE